MTTNNTVLPGNVRSRRLSRRILPLFLLVLLRSMPTAGQSASAAIANGGDGSSLDVDDEAIAEGTAPSAIDPVHRLRRRLHAEVAPIDLRGIYVGDNDIASSTDSLAAAFNVPGVDGFLLIIGWDEIEPAMGQYQWTTLDTWAGQEVSAG